MQSDAMQSDPLLTQDELDYLQKILFKPTQTRPINAAPQLTMGEQLRELLARPGQQQLSLDAHSDNQHLSFPLLLIQDEHSHSRLELGAPLIFEQGVNERPWRLALSVPLTLLDSSDQPSSLKALELSNNGMLVQYGKPGLPAGDQLLQLMLPGERRVQLRARRVRRVSQSRYAYGLQTLHAEDEQTLRHYLFEQHSKQQLHSAAVN